MAYYIVRDIDSTAAVDTPTSLTTTGPDSTGTIRIPTGVSRISRLDVTITLDSAVVASKGSNFVVRLTGTALPQGVQDVVAGSVRVGASETGTVVSAPIQIPVNILVTSGNDLGVAYYYTGTDTGTQELAVGVQLE